MGHEIISKFQHDSVKTISIDKFRVAIPMNNPKAVFGDLVLKCQLGKPFDELKSIMKKENIDELFKKNCFTHFLELSGSRPLRFSMIMVYGLLKCRIMYAGDDGVCHCDGLEMRSSRRTSHKKTPHKGSNKRKVKKDGLLGIVGPRYKVKDLIADLKNKDITKHYREKLCLVWFVHSVLLARDVKKVEKRDLLALADDFGKFNDYPWGYDSYYLTVKYLLKELKPKTTTLYGFPWAFMAWACEAIPPLRKHFTDYPDKVSHPRILRWLAAVESSKKNINEADLFNPPDDAMGNLLQQITRQLQLVQHMAIEVMHPWIVPTIDELGMISFLTLGLVDTKEDPTMELIKKELDGSTSIRRAVRQGQSNVEVLHDQTQSATDLGASSGGVAGGVVCDGGSYSAAASTASRDYEHIGAQQKINIGPSYPSLPSYFHCKCKVCKDREDKLLDKLEAIVEATEELKSRKGVILSNEVREPCTPIVEVRRKRRKIRQILFVLKSAKIATPPAPIVVEV
ncbi:hypothetical protein P3S67_028398 [Capsicum chacoense]